MVRLARELCGEPGAGMCVRHSTAVCGALLRTASVGPSVLTDSPVWWCKFGGSFFISSMAAFHFQKVTAVC